MSDTAPTVRPSSTNGVPPPKVDSSAAPPKDRQAPSKKLPTERINFQKQLDIIRAIGVASQAGTKTANYKDVAALVDLAPNTVSMMSTFMVENGFVERIGNDVMPARAVVEFSQAYTWQPETAPRKLAPLLRRTWFGQLMLTRLAFRALGLDDMLTELAGASSAAPPYRPNLELLIDYAVASGLVRRDGNMLALGEAGAPEGAPSAHPTAGPTPPQTEKSGPAVEQREDHQANRTAGAVATGFMTTEGAVQFHVSVKVTMAEMAGWPPDRIAAFFAGLAQVLAAKKGTEEIR